MKKAVMMVMMGVGMIAGAAPVVSGVQCKQRYPWNGKVDVTFTVTGVTEAEQTADVADGKITHFVMVSTNFVNGADGEGIILSPDGLRGERFLGRRILGARDQGNRGDREGK